MSDFRARIEAYLDQSKFDSQISALQGKEYKVKISADGSNMNIGNINSQMKNAGTAAGKSFSVSLNSALGSVNFKPTIDQIQNLRTSLSSMNFKNNGSIDNIIKDIGELNVAVTSMRANLGSNGDVAVTIKGTDSMNQAITMMRKFNAESGEFVNSTTSISKSSEQMATSLQAATLKNQMSDWLKKNSKATQDYGDAIEQLKKKLDSLDSSGSLTKNAFGNIKQEFLNIKNEATEAGKVGKTWADSFKQGFESIKAVFDVRTVLNEVYQGVKEGVQSIIDLDTALVDLQKTSDATAAELNNFYYAANDIAISLGATTKEVIEAASEWSRLGYSIKDAEEMAKTSSIFASISPEMDMSKATNGLVSAMKAFDIEANDALDGIASKVNAIGNTQAVDNNDLVEILTRSSSAMKEANNTLDETIALGTAATEITRDAAGVGQALKTMSMRLRNYDEETQSTMGDVEVLTGKIADLTKTANSPGGISLFKDSAKTEFKSTTELLRDISKIYDQLTDKQQAGLLEVIAGKRQGQIAAAIINNFDAVEKSLNTMKNSAGGAMKEMEIIEQSAEFKINAFKETLTGIFQNLVTRGTITNVTSFATGILKVIDAITSKIGLLGTALIGLNIAKFIKNFD